MKSEEGSLVLRSDIARCNLPLPTGAQELSGITTEAETHHILISHWSFTDAVTHQNILKYQEIQIMVMSFFCVIGYIHRD